MFSISLSMTQYYSVSVLAVTKAQRDCCKLTLNTTEKDQEKYRKQLLASLLLKGLPCVVQWWLFFFRTGWHFHGKRRGKSVTEGFSLVAQQEAMTCVLCHPLTPAGGLKLAGSTGSNKKKKKKVQWTVTDKRFVQSPSEFLLNKSSVGSLPHGYVE